MHNKRKNIYLWKVYSFLDEIRDDELIKGYCITKDNVNFLFK